jgi:hypothetical protein
MNSTSQMNRLRSFTISLVSRFLAVFILSSFSVTLLPLAGTSANSSMPCCAGKVEGHCDSGLQAPKPVAPPDDPMCGLKSQPLTSESLDAVTVVAEPAHHSDSHESTDGAYRAFTAASVDQQCHMECGACATATSRHKREKSVVQAKTTHAPAATDIARNENRTTVFSANENWTRISPRGPPARG